jgi:hypothetical protein
MGIKLPVAAHAAALSLEKRGENSLDCAAVSCQGGLIRGVVSREEVWVPGHTAPDGSCPHSPKLSCNDQPAITPFDQSIGSRSPSFEFCPGVVEHAPTMNFDSRRFAIQGSSLTSPYRKWEFGRSGSKVLSDTLKSSAAWRMQVDVSVC